MKKTGPVSTRVQLDDGTVVRRHQDHIRRRENEVVQDEVRAGDPDVTDSPSVTPTAPGVSNLVDVPVDSSVPKSPPVTPATPSSAPVESSPATTRPVRKRAGAQWAPEKG